MVRGWLVVRCLFGCWLSVVGCWLFVVGCWLVRGWLVGCLVDDLLVVWFSLGPWRRCLEACGRLVVASFVGWWLGGWAVGSKT